MQRPPNVAYAVRNQRTRVHVPPRWLPIVVVPGIMGTRLTDPREDELVWNPVGEPVGDGPGVFTVNVEKLAQISSPLVPDETHWYDRLDEHNKVKDIRHFYNLIPEFYGPLVRKLTEATDTMKEWGFRPRVYCCGYDWRQDNARSALRLATVVDEALRETGAPKVILVAHSMGGLIARYYSRVLGGESRIHKMILVGSPSLGAPGAYAQLKNGPYGFYFKDLMTQVGAAPEREEDDGDAGAHVIEPVNTATQLINGILGGLRDGIGGGVKNFFGDIYLALCLGAGKFFTRKEARYFARQITALYQLLPNNVFCRKYKHWIVFDPLTTGYLPTGPLTVFPTLLDLPLLLASGVANAANSAAGREVENVRRGLAELLGGAEEGEASGRATRNAAKLEERLVRTVELMGSDEEGAIGEAVEQVLWIYEQADRGFFDGASNKKLYNDIYTGLMDIAAQRALVASNLELAYRFDEALTVDYREAEPTNLMSVIKAMVKPLVAALSGPPKFSHRADATPAQIEAARAEHRKELEQYNEEKAMDRLREEIKEKQPRLYFHPETVSIYCKTLQGEAGCLLIPTKVVSRDDSNLVNATVLPTHNALPAAMIPDAIESPLLLGDATVPQASAMPPEELRSCYVTDDPVENAAHGGMCALDSVIAKVLENIDLTMEYYAKQGA